MEEEFQESEFDPIPESPVRRTWILALALSGLLILVCSAGVIVAILIAGPNFMDRYLLKWIKSDGVRTYQSTQINTMGDPNAPIHMIEYGDFQCPFCLQFWRETEPDLIRDYVDTGKVYFEYRTVVIVGPESQTAGEGAYCAGDQGKFWEFHDTLYSNWTGENVGNFTRDKLVEYARTLELDSILFEQCLSRGDHKKTVERDGIKAKTDDVHATPTFIINGSKIEGAQSYKVLKHILDELLQGEFNIETG